MKKLLLSAALLLSLNVFSQWDFGCNKVEIQSWNDYSRTFVYESSEKTTTVFSFEDDFTLFRISGYVNVVLLTKNLEVDGNKLTFNGVDSQLDEVYVVLDYDYNLMKVMAEIDGKAVLFVFTIVSQKENGK